VKIVMLICSKKTNTTCSYFLFLAGAGSGDIYVLIKQVFEISSLYKCCDRNATDILYVNVTYIKYIYEVGEM
jgi:hypothetical protein